MVGGWRGGGGEGGGNHVIFYTFIRTECVRIFVIISLKVGSFSFECIMILLIYFINCQKAYFTRK